MSTGARTKAEVVAAPGAMRNPGFESGSFGINNDPEGWMSFQHAGPPSYAFALDFDVKRSGKASMRIVNTGPEPYGTVAQLVPAAGMAGRVASFTVWMKTTGARDGGPAVVILGKNGDTILAHNFKAEPDARGTSDWTRYRVSIKVPRQANQIEVGVMLQGAGIVWFDDAEFEFLPA